MALVTEKKYGEIKGNIVQNVDWKSRLNLVMDFFQRKDYFAYPC